MSTVIDTLRAQEREAQQKAAAAAELIEAARRAVEEAADRKRAHAAAMAAWERGKPERERQLALTVEEMEHKLATVPDPGRAPLALRQRCRGFLLVGDPAEMEYIAADYAASQYLEVIHAAQYLEGELMGKGMDSELADELECRAWDLFIKRVRVLSGETPCP